MIDPLVPSEDRERFLAALDRDVERLHVPVRILVSIFWHTRSARELAERYDAEVWAPSRARAAVERRVGRVTPFKADDRLPGGVIAIPTARSTEVVFHIPGHRTLVPGDVILGADGGDLRLCPASWLPDGIGQAELRESLLPLLDLDVERVLVSHGMPVLEGGSDALARLLG